MGIDDDCGRVRCQSIAAGIGKAALSPATLHPPFLIGSFTLPFNSLLSILTIDIGLRRFPLCQTVSMPVFLQLTAGLWV